MNERAKPADRQAMKREYKEGYRPAGVYRIVNTRNGRALVGSSPNLPAIWNRKRMELQAGLDRIHPELQRDWKELGPDAFVFEVLEELTPPEGPGWEPAEDLVTLLQLWLGDLQPYGEKGYNRRPKTS